MGLFDDSQNEERTEAATQFRREEFRRQGTVAMSREVGCVALLFVTGFTLSAAGSRMMMQFQLLTDRFFRVGPVKDLGKQEALEIGAVAVRSLVAMTAPVVLVAAVAGALVCIAQVGFYVTFEPLSPKWERLDPMNGFQKILSLQGTMEAAKAVLKIVVVGAVAWTFLKGQVPVAGIFFQKSVQAATPEMLHIVLKLFYTVLVSLTAIAAIDYGFQRWQHEKRMRMTRREAKEEFKLREGDPLIKSRIKSIQRRLASRRMMEEVPKADVIVTNPTHFAVALRYDSETMGAPKVVAKGAGVVAQKIKELARLHRVPIVENKPLARLMFKEIEIGQFIPRDLYKAVAEVLAYVYRLKRAAVGSPSGEAGWGRAVA